MQTYYATWCLIRETGIYSNIERKIDSVRHIERWAVGLQKGNSLRIFMENLIIFKYHFTY